MKNSLILVAFCLCLLSCASVSPVGSWDYTITGTPNGDYAGVLIVTKEKKDFAAKLTTQGTELPFNKFVYDAKTKKAAGNFDYQGLGLSFDAAVTTTSMNGNISTDDAQFPFKASKKK